MLRRWFIESKGEVNVSVAATCGETASVVATCVLDYHGAGNCLVKDNVLSFLHLLLNKKNNRTMIVCRVP